MHMTAWEQDPRVFFAEEAGRGREVPEASFA